MTTETRYRICPLCEATCGLELKVEGRQVTEIRGDSEDAFSEGYVCPKGVALKDLDADPNRLRTPMIRRGDVWSEVTWDEAFAEIDRNLTPIIAEYGKNAVAAYLGNPTVHNTGLSIYSQAFLRTLGSVNLFSASTVDQIPKQLAVAAMFGTGLTVPIPDLDRCSYLIMLGANPLVSNGSLLTAPNIGERLKRIRARGGKIVVVDPKRTKTAKAADEYLPIRPGTDAYFLFGIVHTLLAENLVAPGRLEAHTEGLDAIGPLAEPFDADTVSAKCGIPADTIRTIARELAASDAAAVYTRMGASTQAFGTLANWLAEVIHVLTGNLDREGGVMFAMPATGGGNTKGTPGIGKGFRMNRRTSRVRNRPEIFGEFPVACLAEEIDTPGDGQIRALVTVAGNPVLSTPDGARLAAAMDSLDFMLSFDIYLNETTRHANVILPGLSPLESCHYDMAFSQLAVHNHARYSPPMFDVPEGQQPEWESMLRLVGILSGLGPNGDTKMIDDMVLMTQINKEVGLETSPIHGRAPEDIQAALEPRRGPERMLDFMLRTGPSGEGFGADPEGLTLAKLEAAPHGIDLGPLEPRIPEVLRTASGKIELAPEIVVSDVQRLQKALSQPNDGMLLIGRRQLRSNNSWMHNLPRLVSGKPRCTLQIHPEDANRFDLKDGALATVTSVTGSITVSAEITDDLMPGVVSVPHGWGHDLPGARLDVAAAHAGANSNLIAGYDLLDEPSGNAVLNGIPVTIARAETVPSEDASAAAIK